MHQLSSYPAVAAQLDPVRNGLLDAAGVPAKSARSLWWRCPKGSDHVWLARVYSRTNGNGCPFCAGKRVSETNSVAALRPDLASEWHTEQNSPLRPADVTCGSNKKVWWRCAGGADHEWRAAISSRAGGNGCPFCAGKRPSVSNSIADRAPLLAAEWHRKKNGALSPCDLPCGSTKEVWWKCSRGRDHEWKTSVAERVRSGSRCPFCTGQKASVTNSLASIAPDIARGWHPELNGELTPERVTAKSDRVVWWMCDVDPSHAWTSTIGNRTRLGRGCPYCAGQRVTPSSSLGALHPSLVSEWDPERNGELTPYQVAPSARARVWWKCPAGPDHEWSSPVYARTSPKLTGCPFCSGHRASVTNSLATRFPSIAREWHPKANGTLTPVEVTHGSSRRVWWRCQFGHEWRAQVRDRTRPDARGCPVCARPHRASPVMTSRRRKGARMPGYEGPRHGPVRRVHD